jgi:hypothetical protein
VEDAPEGGLPSEEVRLLEGDAMDYSELNAYMREQRHAARASRARLEPSEETPRRAEDQPRRPKVVDDYAELNADVREQRHPGRAGRGEDADERSGFFAHARGRARPEAVQSGEDWRADGPAKGVAGGRQRGESDYAEPSPFVREQRLRGRDPERQRGRTEEIRQQRHADRADAPDYAEITAYAREQRRAARANKARADLSDLF